MSWVNGRLCGFDIETTGEEPEWARIVAATLVLVGGDRPSHEFRLLLDPGVDILAASTPVHGITTEQVTDSAGSPFFRLHYGPKSAQVPFDARGQ